MANLLPPTLLGLLGHIRIDVSRKKLALVSCIRDVLLGDVSRFPSLAYPLLVFLGDLIETVEILGLAELCLHVGQNLGGDATPVTVGPGVAKQEGVTSNYV